MQKPPAVCVVYRVIYVHSAGKATFGLCVENIWEGLFGLESFLFLLENRRHQFEFHSLGPSFLASLFSSGAHLISIVAVAAAAAAVCLRSSSGSGGGFLWHHTI